MEFCKVVVLRGEIPDWAGAINTGSGDGAGYGYGDGYGYGSGAGYGYGAGYGSGDGAGYGDGYGYGSGAGYGYGDGAGYGYGDGYGYGSGDGAGYGYGDGYGYGYGSGDGAGYGYGSGDGAGYGYGSGKETQNYKILFEQQLNGWPEAVQSRLQELELDATAIAFWRSDSKGLPSNGGSEEITPAAPGVVHELTGSLKICTSRGLHATMDPDKWEGERLWVVALFGEVQWQEDKCAALKREILAEIQL